MGQFPMVIYTPPGSLRSGNQQDWRCREHQSLNPPAHALGQKPDTGVWELSRRLLHRSGASSYTETNRS